MKKFAYKYISVAVIAGCSLVLPAQGKNKGNILPEIDIRNLAIDQHDDEVALSFLIDATNLRPGKDREYTITPTIFNPDHTDSIEFDPVTVAGRNLYFFHERNNHLAFDQIYRAGKVDTISYSYRAATPEWIDTSEIVLAMRMRNCCDYTTLPSIPVGNVEKPEMKVIIDYGNPKNVAATLPVKTRTIDGRAYINFPVNRTELYPDYMNNPAELRKIIGTIDSVKLDNDIIVDSLFIKGYASPEGSYENNVRLAKGRTETLKDYVEQMYSFPKGFIRTSYEPEDWAGLREYVYNSNIRNRDGILEIIDGDLLPDPKNSAIQKKYPVEYAFLLKNVYPELRHSDYSIYYTIRTFTDPKEIIELTKTAPGKLSEEEVAFALSALTPGSAEYFDFCETAARLFPHSEVLNLDAANAAIEREDYKGAERYLDRAGNSARVVYTRGVIAALQGNPDLAKTYYEQAERMGAKYATEALARLRNTGDGKLRIVPVTPSKPMTETETVSD
ncbi:MAG: hypothetical protein HDR88_17430 [Bacteroides sp.]|nr:hypothetical protein [Bacteroides sp.]